MRSILAGLRRLVLPWGAGPNDPQIVIGPGIPAELVAKYGSWINGAVIFRISATKYAYSALLSGGGTPLRVEGFVNLARAPGNQISEIYGIFLTDGDTHADIYFGGLSGTTPPVWAHFTSEVLFAAHISAAAANFSGDVGIAGILSTGIVELSNAEGIVIDFVSQPRGLKSRIDSAAPSAAVGAEATVFTLPAMTFQAGRAYEMKFGALVIGSVANQSLFQVRQTNLAGAIKHQARFNIPGAGGGNAPWCESSAYIRRTAVTDITDTLALTLQASAGTSTMHGAAISVRYFEVRDIGAAADYANAINI